MTDLIHKTNTMELRWNCGVLEQKIICRKMYPHSSAHDDVQLMVDYDNSWEEWVEVPHVGK